MVYIVAAQRTQSALPVVPISGGKPASSALPSQQETTARLKVLGPGAVEANTASRRSAFKRSDGQGRPGNRTYVRAERVSAVLVVVDLPLMREAIAKVLADQRVPVLVVTVDSIAAAADIATQSFDLILLDLNLPGHRNFDSIALMWAQRPRVPIVVLGAQDDTQTVLAALDSGAMGFIPKRYSGEDIANAVRIVLLGGVYVPPIVADTVVAEPHEFRRRVTDVVPAADPRLLRRRATDLAGAASLVGTAAGGGSQTTLPEPPKLDITPRQSQVLSLLIKGLCNKSICRELSLSENTVKSHIAAIFKSLGVHNRTSAVVEMSSKGYVLEAS